MVAAGVPSSSQTIKVSPARMLRSIPSSMRSSVGYGLAVADGPSAARCWALIPQTPNPLDLHGPHDLRHTFATWLEDAAIPVRVIDELMGHAGGRRPDQGSRIGRIYRETTPKMLVRVVGAIEQRLSIVLTVAAEEGTSWHAATPHSTGAASAAEPSARGNRCIDRRSRRSRPTVGAKAMRSTSPLVCVHM
jgi:Phage integrase family